MTRKKKDPVKSKPVKKLGIAEYGNLVKASKKLTEITEQEENRPVPKKKKAANYLNNRDMLAQVILSKEQGRMTDELAKMLQTLAYRYGKKGNFANYTYNEDMQAYAMLMLVKTWNSFDPAKSSNPFAFFTQCVKNSFIQFLNQEKRQRDIRDAQLVDKGLSPSYSYQMEYAARAKEHREVDPHDQHLDDGDDHLITEKEEDDDLLTY